MNAFSPVARITWWQWCLLTLAAVAWLLPAAPVAAQQASPITIDVQAGFDDTYKVGQWFPIQVTISNDGPDVRGTLEWQFTANNSNVFQQDIDLPNGARKRVTIDVFTTDFSRSGELRLVGTGGGVLREGVRLSPIDTSQFFVGVLSSDPTLLNTLTSMSFANISGTSVAHVDPTQLPTSAPALAGFNALFIHDIATADLSPEQHDALKLWVELGGQLIVGGGVNAEQTAAGISDLLPVTVGALQSDVSLDALAQFARQGDLPQNQATTTVNDVELNPDASQPLGSSSLITTHNVGAGQVLFAAFDLGALRQWNGEAKLWERLLAAEDQVNIGLAYRWRNDNLLRSTLQLSSLQLPPTWLLFMLIFGYIVFVGPLNFLLLRRFRRVEWAWVTVPVIVVLCLASMYGASLLLRGNTAQMTQLAIVQGVEDQSSGLVTAFVGVFSPQRRSYNVGFDAQTLISNGSFDGFTNGEATVANTDSGTEVRDLLIDVSALRTFIAERATNDVPAITSDLVRDRREVGGTVENSSAVPLEGAMLVYDDSMQELGTLQPGAQVDVALRRSFDNFPPTTFAEDDERLFNRDSVLQNLFSFGRFDFAGSGFGTNSGMPDKDGIYLIGWREQPTLSVDINGAPSNQRGTTMYIIRLDG